MSEQIRPSLDQLRERFSTQFVNATIELEDQSHLHAGHAGSQGGAGHYRVAIVSDRFIGLSTVAKHRLVYDAVRDWMPHRVHALTILAVEPKMP
jgi:BolA family transcriptional regulator, general stress-responsive regulator